MHQGYTVPDLLVVLFPQQVCALFEQGRNCVTLQQRQAVTANLCLDHH